MPYETSDAMTVAELLGRLIEHEDKLVCQACFTKLAVDDIDGFDYLHEGGILIKEKGRVWLYLHCKKCGYDTALWKLRIEGLY